MATGPLDETALPTETSGESRTCPRAELVFEAIGRQGNPDQLSTAGVFGKPKLGRIFAGQNLHPGRPDADYLWAPCATGPDDDAYCEPVPTNPVSGYALDDATVMDRVLATIDSGVPAAGGPDAPRLHLRQPPPDRHRRPRDRHRAPSTTRRSARPTPRSSAWSRRCGPAASGSARC